MKTVFSCLTQSCKKLSKYIVFSIFSLAFLLVGTFANAEATNYSFFDDYTSGAVGTSISGTLENKCEVSGAGGYKIIESSYFGSNGNGQCISYTAPGGTVTYYLQARETDYDDTNTWNKLTFQINSRASSPYNFVIVAEKGYSLSAQTTADYDLYKLSSGVNYDYEQVRNDTGSVQPDRVDLNKKGTISYNATSGIYSFEYYLRNSEFREHTLEIYFYDAAADLENITPNITIKYILAKPISDYKFNVNGNHTNQATIKDCSGGYNVCINYKPDPNTGTTVEHGVTQTNKFHVTFSNAAAFYYSTANTHDIGSVTMADVVKYNSFYATNTFYNDGSSDKIIYYYYNATDGTTYSKAVTATEKYSLELTIDSSGLYEFYIEDIFGNVLTPTTHADDNDHTDVEDVSNRTLKIYYLAYNADGNSLHEHGELLRNFQLKSGNLSLLTNENVTIGVEFYSIIDINDGYGVIGSGSASILENPLYYENDDKQVRIDDGTNNKTFFCRLLDATDDSITNHTCVDGALDEGARSRYVEQPLLGRQQIQATDTGKKAVDNVFNPNNNGYYSGMLGSLSGTEGSISRAIRGNRTNLVLNENGVFYVRVQDIHGNYTESTIEVSIIDQHNPVITLNSQGDTFNNAICSNLYVIGAGGSIVEYPVGQVLSNGCSNTEVSYNGFKEVTRNTEKQDTITLKLSRTTDNITVTNGFYDNATSLATFNYADAIRMALLRASDSMIIGGDYVSAAKTVEKSVYEKTEDDYTSFALYTRHAERTLNHAEYGKMTGLVAITNTPDTLFDYGYTLDGTTYQVNSDFVIKNNLTQYSSELNYYDDGKTEFVVFDVYEALPDNQTDFSTTPACNSVDDRTGNVCNNIVNTFIDKGINFKLTFRAKDRVGNVSHPISVEVEVVDNTAPGLANISADGELLADPTIALDNVDTTCRLEIGSVIQNKNELLKCYGLIGSDDAYKFADNATAYLELTNSTNYAAANYLTVNYSSYGDAPNGINDIVYKYALSNQLYTTGADSYDSRVKVYICQERGASGCASGGWEEVGHTTSLEFENAGNYKIKFVIEDVGHNYRSSQTHDVNKTEIILCYYVNPRVLLVRPIAKTLEYGTYDLNSMTIDYCVYATTNTDSFYYNLFALKYNASGEYLDTYDFVDKNYENSVAGTTYGLVYCTGSVVDNTNAVKKSLSEVMASEYAEIKGKMGITYATGDNALYMEYNQYNAYLDAGYYYITMGNLSVGAAAGAPEGITYDQNYVLRLHPSYLLDGKDPNDKLVNYNDSQLTTGTEGEQYKYGKTQASYGETISNVLYTVTQKELTITANGADKVFGNPDTNYPQASDTRATINASNYVNEEDNVDTPISRGGYLGGFEITGLVENSYVKDFSNTHNSKARYDYIVSGFLRREIGEEVGTYRICNSKSIGTEHASCNISIKGINEARTHTLVPGVNVYYVKEDLTYAPTTGTTTIRYGMYILLDGVYYKLTRDNTDLTNSKFTDVLTRNVWAYHYDTDVDTQDFTLSIEPNLNNGNQNYYLVYVDSLYTIRPGELIVQPGSNQGKEYSNPQHNDPRFEIVIYGESRNAIIGSEYGASFNGYTATISDTSYPGVPDVNDLADLYPYNNDSAGFQKDNTLYFTERRTTTREAFGSTRFTYKFDPVSITRNSENEAIFTWMGNTYVYSEADGEVCLYSSYADGSYTQCQSEAIGVYKIEINADADKVIITTVGALTDQTYGLLAGSTNVSGTATISRGAEASNINVGWYSYDFQKADMHVVKNSKQLCEVTDYVYEPGEGTDLCSNYNLSWDANAPDVSEDVSQAITTQGAGSLYKHNGKDYCGEVGDGKYSASCEAGGATDVTEIKFFIFKRDVIVSFNANKITYGNGYDYLNANIFTVETADPSNISHLPKFIGGDMANGDMITCYKKSTSGAYLAKNNLRYTAIDPTECNTNADYGISAGDSWDGSLKLRFFLAQEIQTTFAGSSENTYAVPAGKYKVFATIGDNDGSGNYSHANYNLVFIDFHIIQTGDVTSDAATVKGALEVLPKDVTLKGTYYQKEYGQAKYNSYGPTGDTLTASNQGKGTYSAVLDHMKSDTANKMFDNHFFYCEKATSDYGNAVTPQSIVTGCEMINVDTANDSNYGYGSLNNIFGYTTNDMVTLGNKTDDIYANFSGTPIRGTLVTANTLLADEYGLLSDVGFYVIDLNDIVASVAQYGENIFAYESTIIRYTNYNIAARETGGLYITPASININVASSQTKMYGCSYNSFNDSTVYNYTYGKGYTNCVENNGTLYDLGYKYEVVHDKYNYLKSYVKADPNNAGKNMLDYSELKDSIGQTLDVCDLGDRNKGLSCYDISYSSATTNYKYDVNPQYDSTNSVVDFGKPENTALNSGTLFRMPITTMDNGSFAEPYSYSTYFNFATNAQKTDGSKIYQLQDVGNYVLTLGNLDSLFNTNLKCGSDSTPLENGGTSLCKNFILNYNVKGDENHFNTAYHTVKEDGEHVFAYSTDADDLYELDSETLLFTITKRSVVLNTEYNYKLYGDTDPVEGFTCLNLRNMFGLSSTDDYEDRSYCSGDTTFISTGVTRYYAVDNSLAKAPWTAWTIDAYTGTPTRDSYTEYDDILFDVISPDSQIIRKGQGGNAAAQDDAGGEYEYIYIMSLNDDLNGANNYEIKYITGFDSVVANSTIGAITPDNGKVYGEYANVGFAFSDTDGIARWYGNDAHACYGKIDTVDANACENYTGVETYRFYINGITLDTEGSFEDDITYMVGEKKSTIVERVFFEIVQREIYIQTVDVNKDYGEEEDYLDFEVRLVTPDDENGGYKNISYSNEWGNPDSLSRTDYDNFFPEANGRQFSLKNFMGTDQASAYRGSTNAGAFGIYFYRTYGENVGEYTIVACATQYANDDDCAEFYADPDNFGVTGDLLDATRREVVGQFIYASNVNYRASNYIVNTIPATLTISQRKVVITPHSNQGFQYGNYVAGKVIDPITYYETSSYDYINGNTPSTQNRNGVINGGLLNPNDHVNNQIALCIYDITGVITCINDRQNSSGGYDALVGYVFTTLHNAADPTVAGSEITATNSQGRHLPEGVENLLNYNVYNDSYDSDNDNGEYARHALNRFVGTTTNQRYNRNVGEYTIDVGELMSQRYCTTGASAITTNCLNPNYFVEGFTSGVKYVITPADITITPTSGQSKVYGTEDVELEFVVKTTFLFKDYYDTEDGEYVNFDSYHCTTSGKCQSKSDFGTIDGEVVDGTNEANHTLTIVGFVYGENIAAGASDAHNYGVAKNSNKTAEKTETSIYTDSFSIDKNVYPKYYDKYCYEVDTTKEGCNKFIHEENRRYSYLTYDSTSRIILGYFYIEKYDQRAKNDLKILTGMRIALNEWDQANYRYAPSLGDDTGITFEIEKLEIDATINDVTKVYGQATDMHKADSLADTCTIDDVDHTCTLYYAVGETDNASYDNEGRLEYNFNVVDDAGESVHLDDGIVVLTKPITLPGDDTKYYYTQSGRAETKNLHLGLSVVRASGADVCLIDDDKYGCEDVGTYALVFRKVAVPNEVDQNYAVTYGGQDGTTVTKEQSGDYIYVDNTTKVEDEKMGHAASGSVAYIKFSDTISYSDATTAYVGNHNIDILSGYSATLEIVKRDVMFYVGTYDSDGVVAERFVIEENEEVPEFPALHNAFTTSSTPTVTSKTTYHNTWFDINEFGQGQTDMSATYAARQVRTSDNVYTSLDSDTKNLGVGICKVAVNDIQLAKYGIDGCSADNFVTYDLANTISGNDYVFSTSQIGDYPIIRNPNKTYIRYGSETLSYDYEFKNYNVVDYNGTLVIYEDRTAPTIQIGTDTFVIEANANSVTECTAVNNDEGESYSYKCNLEGLRFTEETKSLGAIISYITTHFSNYGATTSRDRNSITDKDDFKLQTPVVPVEGDDDWIYMPVNNIGNKMVSNESTTLYADDRTAHTYKFDGTNINSDLMAISSIISFFNINSYDYSYIRNNEYMTKRYTPRYYFFIEGGKNGNTLTKFDPTYVGDFEVKIYAIDHEGNQAVESVTLRIIDTTKPITGSMHLFNAPVQCKDATCTTSNIDNWYVSPGYVPISAFVKHDENGVVNQAEGRYIMQTSATASGSLVDIYSGELVRYSKDTSSGSFYEDALGDYVYVDSATPTKHIKATEIEHTSWYNGKDVYIVVVGGSDNSYIDPTHDDALSQWNTYYTTEVEGATSLSWRKYDRHSQTGEKITFGDGITSVYIRLMDQGTSYTQTAGADPNVYYNAIYLSNNNTCSAPNCTIIENSTEVIQQIIDLEMTPNKSNDVHEYKFKINALELTFNDLDGSVKWRGQSEAENASDGVFDYGIMTCTISINAGGNYEVDCETLYNLAYKSGANGDRKEVEDIVYTTSSAVNINDVDELGLDQGNNAGESTYTSFFKDRRYVYIDTTRPEITQLIGDPFSLFEYEEACHPGSTDDRCSNSYNEKFLAAKDKKVDQTAVAITEDTVVVSADALDTNMNLLSTKLIYTGTGYILSTDTAVSSVSSIANKSSGLLIRNGKIMYGSEVYSHTGGDDDVVFSRYKTTIVVYLAAKRQGVYTYFKFTALFDGEKYRVFRQTRNVQTEAYPPLTSAIIQVDNNNIAKDVDPDTIEEVIEFIVSTASVSDLAGYDGAYLDFSINYIVKDAAGNASELKDVLTVRGITYVSYGAQVTAAVSEPAAANVAAAGNNTYVVNANQGVSLLSLLEGFTISNVDYNGINHTSSLMQSLYYNGEAIFENVPYDQNIISYINGLATAPGVYTLKVTSTREVEGKDGILVIEDTPLTFNINVNPNVANIKGNNYTYTVIALILITVAPIVMIGVGKAKKRKNS